MCGRHLSTVTCRVFGLNPLSPKSCLAYRTIPTMPPRFHLSLCGARLFRTKLNFFHAMGIEQVLGGAYRWRTLALGSKTVTNGILMYLVVFFSLTICDYYTFMYRYGILILSILTRTLLVGSEISKISAICARANSIPNYIDSGWVRHI